MILKILKKQIVETIDEVWMGRVLVFAFVGIFLCDFVKLVRHLSEG